MRAENFELQKLIDALEGSCSTINAQIEVLYSESEMDEDDLTQEELQEIDNEIFLCSECGWWYEVCCISERDDEQCICNDCSEDNSD